MSQPKPFSPAARLRSFLYAGRGVRTVVVSQHNAWIHALATVAVTSAGLWCGLSHADWCVLVLAMAGVWTAEALNTALEFLCDVASPEFHPLVEKAKDVAAGAVLLSAAAAVLVGVLVFAAPLHNWLGH